MEQRGIWRAGEAVFAHESEILSTFPAEPAQGCARSRRDTLRWPQAPARLFQPRLPKPLPRMETLVAFGPGSAPERVGKL